MRLSLAGKLALLFAVVTLVILVSTGFVLTFTLYLQAEADAEKYLSRTSESLISDYIDVTGGTISFRQGPEGDSISAELRDYSLSLILFDMEGNHLSSFGFYRLADIVRERDAFINKAFIESFKNDAKPHYRDIQTTNGNLYDTYTQVIESDGKRYAVVQVAQPANMVNMLIRHNVKITLVIIPISIGLSALLGYLVVRKVLQPLKILTGIMSTMSATYLPDVPPITKNTHDEVGTLALTFEKMMKRIREGVSKQKQFVANASHELNTPLARIATTLDVSLDHIADGAIPKAKKGIIASRNESVHLADIVQSLLSLAKTDDVDEPVRHFRLRTLTSGIVRMFERDIQDKRIRIINTLPPTLTVSARYNHLEIIIKNLISNAIKYNRSGGKITLSTVLTEGHIALSIKDTGRGMAQNEALEIFNRFIRLLGAEKYATGTGIGMSLVKQLCEKNNYSLDVQSIPLKGTTVTIGNIQKSHKS